MMHVLRERFGNSFLFPMTHKHFLLIACLAALAGCSSPQKQAVKVGDGTGAGITYRQEFQTAMPVGTPTLPGHGKETSLSYGALSGTGGTSANGIASIHHLEDMSSVVGLQLNIKAAPEGMFYEGWVKSADGTVLNVGHLTNPFNDVRHRVRLEAQKDLHDFMWAFITLEADDGNPEPGEIVAVGTLKQTSR